MSRRLLRKIERLEEENHMLREHLGFCGLKTARVRCSCTRIVPDCYGCIYGEGHEQCGNCDGSGALTILFDPNDPEDRKRANWVVRSSEGNAA